jgi:hypothetical protein
MKVNIYIHRQTAESFKAPLYLKPIGNNVEASLFSVLVVAVGAVCQLHRDEEPVVRQPARGT